MYLREGRATWESEVMLAYLNPTKLVAIQEKGLPLEKKLKRAVDRAQKHLRAEYEDSKRYVLCLDEDQPEDDL
jgi:hypothetical protein